MKLSNFPRKKYIVDNLQYRLLATSLLYIAAVVLVFAGVLFAPLMFAMDADAMGSPAVQEVARQFLTLHARVWPPVMMLVALLVIHNIVFSHRIAGPLYRIRNELKKIGDGNLFVQVKLRKNDYLDKEAASVNDMVEALRGKIRIIEQNQKKANGVLIDLQRALIRGSADEMNDEIEELGGVLERLKESVGQFQVPREMTRGPVAPPPVDTAKAQREFSGAGAPKGV
jgi:methyl-accepting chemotaxis protein